MEITIKLVGSSDEPHILKVCVFSQHTRFQGALF